MYSSKTNIILSCLNERLFSHEKLLCTVIDRLLQTLTRRNYSTSNQVPAKNLLLSIIIIFRIRDFEYALTVKP